MFSDAASPALSNEPANIDTEISLSDAASILFDAAYYLSSNPDVAAAGTDPKSHFMETGWKEGRNPHPLFDTRWYLSSNPDIERASINPLLHYIERGWEERRNPHPDFDTSWYLDQYPDVGSNPLVHYLVQGWRELKDPSVNFSTSHYLEANSDVRESGINPLVHFTLHGRSEGRPALPFDLRLQRQEYRPLVSIIVPNFNHARFLPLRLQSILEQSYENFELIILDDSSEDNSIEVINSYQGLFSQSVRTLFNEKNSGKVFAQWKKGIEAARGDLIWICESDDWCERNFLEKCIKPLVDDSVMIAFGQTQFCDESGNILAGLDDYRERAESGIWNQPQIRFAKEWFVGPFAVSNIIPNVGGCIFRKQKISSEIWMALSSYKICGDWYLYSELANGGRIAYVPDAVSYFRQHGKNTSVMGFKGREYYKEHELIMKALRAKWGVPQDAVDRFVKNVQGQFEYAQAENHVGPFASVFDRRAIIDIAKSRPHILIAFMGFHLGGGELFPIFLANGLVDLGYTVSVLVVSTENENKSMRRMLDRRIAIYERDLVHGVGFDSFFAEAGIDVVHSHSFVIERFFYDREDFHCPVPYISTLHGLYEISDIQPELLSRIIKNVDHWVYLTDKNIMHLSHVPAEQVRTTQIANGTPVDMRDFPFSRQQLGIPEDALLYTIASRAIEGKGWDIAVDAIEWAQRQTDRELHLMLCGSGPEADRLEVALEGNPRYHVVGYQEAICGAYRISDVVLLPTRFGGESFPLGLIQAMQVGTPIIATDIGEIRRMMTDGEAAAGIVVESASDRIAFVDLVAAAILQMTNDAFREERARDARSIGKTFDISVVAKRYAEIYSDELRRAGRRPRNN